MPAISYIRIAPPYTVAAFINPAHAKEALRTYREQFTPAPDPADAPPRPEGLQRPLGPQAMLGINVVCADSDEEAAYHAMTVRGLYHRLSRGTLGDRHPAPDQAIAEMGATPAGHHLRAAVEHPCDHWHPRQGSSELRTRRGLVSGWVRQRRLGC